MKILWTGQFKKDYKRVKKQDKDLAALRVVIETLAARQPLPPRYRDHKLLGRWRNYRECHIEGDWLLIYALTSEALTLERTGSHAELFE